MKTTTAYAEFVEHPRYGKRPHFTGLDVADTPDGKVYCHWHSPVGVRVPNTAVAADTSRQRPATIAVTHYYDARRVCRKCRRPFLFFAAEQKFWYEELRFPLEADCVECIECRKDEQLLRVIRRRYDDLMARPERTAAETLELVGHGLLLVEASVFGETVLPRMRGLLKPLLRGPEGPDRAQAQALIAGIDSAAAR